MNEHKSRLGLPIGFPLEDWKPRSFPPRSTIGGKYCRVEILDADKHAEELYSAYIKDIEGRIWTYLPYGPFDQFEEYLAWMKKTCLGDDPLFHAIIDLKTNKAIGVASFLRIEPGVGVIEVGHINYSALLQKTPIATEAMYLMMRRVFDELGYRRYEWKCDSLNARSRKAAVRLGFVYEGIFRQATIYKSRNRDTAWYSIIDSEWPKLKQAFEEWLDAANFNGDGQQKKSLSGLIEQTRNAKP
jgi:RimJ/RimL family protein N-acetyltransferase